MSFIKKTDSMDIIAIILSAISLILLVIVLLKIEKNNPQSIISAVQVVLKTELKDNRKELAEALKENRTELSSGLNSLTKSLEEKLKLIKIYLLKMQKLQAIFIGTCH